MANPANSYPEFPLSSDKRYHLFGGQQTACSIPQVDNLPARYSNLNRKPILLPYARGLENNTERWETTYNTEHRYLTVSS